MAGGVVLDAYQQAGLLDFRAGKNVGVFSSAGCGKSVVLRAIINEAVALHGDDAVAVCSWYGAAADLIGGVTLHSLFSCSITLLSPDQLLAATMRRPRLVNKLRKIRVWLIDEIFTMTAAWLRCFVRVFRGIASPMLQLHPAGGVQVIGMP